MNQNDDNMIQFKMAGKQSAVQVDRERGTNRLYAGKATKPRSYSKPRAQPDLPIANRPHFATSASCPSFQKDQLSSFPTDHQHDPDIHTALTFGEPIVVPVLPANGSGRAGRSSNSIKYRQSKIDISEPKRNFFTKFSTRTLVLFGVGTIAVLVICAVSVILLATRTLYKIRSANNNKLMNSNYGYNAYSNFNKFGVNPAPSSFNLNNNYGGYANPPVVNTDYNSVNSANYMYQWPTRFDNPPTKSFYDNLYNNNNNRNESLLMTALNGNQNFNSNRPPNFENPSTNFNNFNNLNPVNANFNNEPNVVNEINKSERNVFNWIKNVISDSLYGDRSDGYGN